MGFIDSNGHLFTLKTEQGDKTDQETEAIILPSGRLAGLGYTKIGTIEQGQVYVKIPVNHKTDKQWKSQVLQAAQTIAINTEFNIREVTLVKLHTAKYKATIHPQSITSDNNAKCTHQSLPNRLPSDPEPPNVAYAQRQMLDEGDVETSKCFNSSVDIQTILKSHFYSLFRILSLQGKSPQNTTEV